jgi:hypothetical protein
MASGPGRTRPDDEPPYLGPRIKWVLAVLVIGSVAAYFIYQWWERWVRRGLGWE